MEMVRENMYKSMIDPMEFEESLNYAIDKKKYYYFRGWKGGGSSTTKH